MIFGNDTGGEQSVRFQVEVGWNRTFGLCLGATQPPPLDQLPSFSIGFTDIQELNATSPWLMRMDFQRGSPSHLDER